MAKYTYSSLKKKYNNFVDGACNIDIDGFEPVSEYIIRNLTVQLTALYEASYAEFTIMGGFEQNESEFSMDKKLSSKLKCGKKVTISIGYGDKNKEVFKGYIDSLRVEYEYNYGFSITVTCLDGKGMMMNSYRSEIKTGLKKYSDAIKKTIENYSDFISGSKITATPELTIPFSQLNESDYDFVVRLAKKVNYSFYINLGKAYFVPFAEERTVLLDIMPDESLVRFSLETSLRKRVSKVIVVNNDETDEKKQIKSEVSSINSLESGSSSKAAANSAISENMVKTIVDPAATTSEIAKTIAQAEINRMSYSSVEGTIEMPGLPEILPAGFVSVKGFGTEFEKDYYIKKVTHRLYGDKFTTSIEIGGNGI